jgi:hypothetical protein
MDEDYARRLRNWLRAEPGATPRRAAEEREWLREVPEPGARAAHDRLPAAEAPAPATETHDRLPAAEAHDRLPAAEAHDRLPAAGAPELAAGEPELAAGVPDPGERWTVRGYLPEVPAEDDDWVCPVIVLPVPRPSRENGCRMSEAEARSRRNHPSNAGRRAQAPDAGPMTEAEARSRWNHPTNWHRRRREAEQQQQQQDEPRSH